MKFNVAGRSRDRRRRWSLALAYAVLLASCDSPFAPEKQEVERLDINPPVLTLVVGGSTRLTARVYGPNDAVMLGAKVFWSTQDPTVVTVTQEGQVNAVAAGTAQIAASSGGQSRTIAVTVGQKPIALVRIAPPAATIAMGQSFQLQGEALDGDGNVLPNRVLEWSSNQPTIATVNGAGMVTGVSVGQATVTAIGEGRVGTSLITVTPAPVATLSIAPNGGTVPAGGTLTFSATARDAAGQVITGRQITWRSSNDAVATVSGTGLMTALSPGVATITASAPNAGPNGTTPTASVNVTVLIEPVASAVIVPSPAGVQVGKVVNLTVNLFDSGGEPLSTAGRNISWSSSNPAIATVNVSGAATGVAVGNSTITATITTPGQAGTVQASVLLSVSNQPVTTVVVGPSSGIVHVGYSRLFSAVTLDAQGQTLTGRQVIWTSSNQGVATVDAASGTVTGVNQGTVQILATSDGVQGFATVTVDLVNVSAVTVTPPAATLMPAQTVQLTAVARDSANNPITGGALGGRSTTWSSVTPSAATVSTNGLVTAVAVGSSSVTATIGGATGQSAITVSPLPTATQLAILTQPSASAPNDAAFAVQPVVQLKDANGNNVSTAGILISAAITAPGTGVLGGTASALTNASGAATFSGLRITGTLGARTLTFSAGALTPAVSSGINITPGAATQVVLVTPPPSTANSGQAFSSASVVQLQDVSGNNVPQGGVLVTATVSPSASVTLTGGSTTTNGSGTATFGALTLSGSAGNYTLTFSSGSLTPAPSGSIALSAGSGSKLAVVQQPGGTAQNGALLSPQPQVQLLDGSNNPVALAGVDISAAILIGGGSLGGTTVATTNSSGIATFTNLSITGTVGNRQLLFAAVGYTSIGSGTINITAGPAAKLVLTVAPPSSSQNGSAFSPQPSVTVADANDNPVLQSGTTVSASLSGGTGSLIGSVSANTDGSGVATFAGLGIQGLVAPYTVTFSSGSLSSVASGVTLTPGAATQLTITTQPAGAFSGSAFNTQPVLQLRDAQGNAVPQAGVTVTPSIASSPGGSPSLLGGAATTDGNGTAVFSGLGLSGTVGSYTIGFSAGAFSATSTSFNLAHGAAAALVIQTQPAGATSGAAFGTQPVVAVRDAQGNAVTQAGIVITGSPSAGASVVGSNTATTNGSGVATFAGFGISGLVGNYTVDFSTSGVPNVTSGSITLAAGAPSQLVMASQPAASIANGGSVSASVQVRDNAGNSVSVDGLSVTAVLSPASAVLGGTATVNTTSGIASFSGLTITGTVGNYTLNFSATGVTGTSSSPIALTPGAAAQLVMAAQPPANVLSGATFSAAVQVQDASGNAVPQAGIGVNATWSGSGTVGGGSVNTDGAGVATFSSLSITATSAETSTLTFSSTGLTSATSSNISVTLPASQLAMVGQPPATSASGATFGAVSVQLLDVNSNPVNQAGVAVSVAITGGGATLIGTASANTDASGVATFSGLGIAGTVNSYTLTFTSGSLTSATSSAIALTHGAATQLVFAPAPPSSSTSGAPLASHAVQLRDAQGNDVTTAGVSVSVSVAPGSATLTGASATTDAGGLATFGALTITGNTSPPNYTLTYSATGVSGTVQAVVALSFFDIETAPDVTKVTLANPDGRGEGALRVSILPDEWSLADVGNLSGTPTLPANTQEEASSRYRTITRADQDQLRYGAIRRGTVVSNPFGANP